MLFLAIKPFYIFSLSIVVICILYIVFITVIYPTILNNAVKRNLTKLALANNKKMIIVKTKSFDATFKIKIEEKVYLAKVIYTPKNCDLQINNVDTFVVYKKASDGNYKHKVLSNMSTFMKANQQNKIILLANKAKTIKKVINECEMIMVNPDVDVHGTKIYNLNQYENLFK